MPESARADKSHATTHQTQAAGPAQQGAQPELMPLVTPGVQRAVLDPGRATPGDILALQRASGNRAVSGLLSPRASSPDSEAAHDADPGLESRLAAGRGGGSPLASGVRERMEARFGANFGGVRLHTGAEAVQMNRDLSAQAFTYGQDVYLGAGQAEPGTTAGDRLLAHELTHVVQQTGQPAALPVSRLGLGVAPRAVQRWGRKQATPPPAPQPLAALAQVMSIPACSNFVNLYMTATAGMNTLRVADLRPRLMELVNATLDYRLEDHSPFILNDNDVRVALRNINDELLTHPAVVGDVQNVVADLLVATCLIPVAEERHTQKKPFGPKFKYERHELRAISPSKLVRILQDLGFKIYRGQTVTDVDQLSGIANPTTGTMPQKIAKLSLVNMRQGMRAMLTDAASEFTALLNSPHLMSFLMASGGSDEQRFLSTCGASALNQEILAKTSSIAALVAVGRQVARAVRMQAQDVTNDKLGERYRLRGERVGAHALRMAQEAEAEFTRIENEARTIAQSGAKADPEALKSLVRSWSRVMQKLGNVSDLSAGKSGVAILSKKYVDDSWAGSAALQILSVKPWFNHPMRRTKDVNQTAYLTHIAEALDIGEDPADIAKKVPSQRIKGFITMGTHADHLNNMDTLWTVLYKMGGSLFNTSHHALFMKAILMGNAKGFAIGDPKVQRYEYKTVPEMLQYIISNDILVTNELQEAVNDAFRNALAVPRT